MDAFRDQFIEIKIAVLERILSSVGAREREKIFHDAREPLRFVMQHA